MRKPVVAGTLPALRRLPALSCVPGQTRAHDAGVGRRGEAGHIDADLGNQDLRRPSSHTTIGLEPLNVGREDARWRPRCAASHCDTSTAS